MPRSCDGDGMAVGFPVAAGREFCQSRAESFMNTSAVLRPLTLIATLGLSALASHAEVNKVEKIAVEIRAIEIPPSPRAIKEAKKWHELSLLPSFGSSKVGVTNEPLDELPPKGYLSINPTHHRSKSRVYVEKLVSLEDMAKMPSGLSADELKILDDLEKKLMTMSADETTDLLMRSMPAGRVASHWHEVEHLKETSAFWRANNGTQAHYKLRYTTHPRIIAYDIILFCYCQ